jgi:hypothetical protein
LAGLSYQTVVRTAAKDKYRMNLIKYLSLLLFNNTQKEEEQHLENRNKSIKKNKNKITSNQKIASYSNYHKIFFCLINNLNWRISDVLEGFLTC